MNNHLLIGLWNTTLLTQYSSELKVYVIFHDIDFMLISETHFTNRRFFKLTEYTMSNKAHPDGKAHSESAIII